MHCAIWSPFRHAAGRAFTDLGCHWSPRSTHRLIKNFYPEVTHTTLLTFHWQKHVIWPYLTQWTWGSITLSYVQEKKIRIFVWMFLTTAESEESCLSEGHAPSYVQWLVTEDQGPHPNSGQFWGATQFPRLSGGLTEAIVKMASWPKLSLHPVLLSSLPFYKKLFPKALPKEAPACESLSQKLLYEEPSLLYYITCS